jgi:OOP family OmpA-OmpF porin
VTSGYDPASVEFRELRELLVGPERRRLDELKRRLDAAGLTPEELAEHLPEAIALRSGRDRQLGLALAPTVENALRESVRRNPREIATAIFPVLGPAIRKAIAETMAGLVRSINTAIEHSLSLRGLRWRLEAWRTGVPYAQIVLKHALVYRVEQVFLIHAETGILLVHVAPPELKVADADLVSGMLTAIQDFVSDSFKVEEEGGRLRTFTVGELTVLVEPGPQAVLAAVVRGHPPDSLLMRLQSTLETLHVQFGHRFAEFDGDATPYESARPLLEECLETVLTTDAPRRRSRLGWLRWAVPVVAVLGFLGWRAFRAERQFQRALDGLVAEPGIVVVGAERDWGRWRVNGLRDPLAADPAAVLAGLGLDSARLEGRWRPYLSLEPPVVLARARQALSAPASVAFSLEGGALVGRGSAPIDWLARSASLAALPPGVARIDLAAVEPTLAPELAALGEEVERQRVLFPVGSAELGRAGAAVVAEVAGRMTRLLAATAAPGYRLELALLGRTDPTGSDATNQALSRLRADAVARRLAALGLPAGALASMGLGTGSPLTASSAEEQAQLNRSVSFSIRLSPVGGERGP